MKAITTKRFFGDESGAVAATYALALIPLIAFAGVAFDYARVMGLDSELQNGADQAALAAASQLDGRDGACERAANAASGMLQNLALLSSGSQSVTVASETACDATGQIRFYQDKEKETPATGNSNANFVEVIVDERRLDYSLLAVVDLDFVDVSGVAFAGLGSAVCKTPPLMLCNPNETGDPNFDINQYIGHGIRLIANDSGGLVPGNFGYLETNVGNGASALREVLGRTEIPGDCLQETGVTTKPGLSVSVFDAINTRFGIEGSGLNQACGANQSLCPASGNSRIDLLQGNNKYDISKNGFTVGDRPYLPDSPVNDHPDPGNLDPMGYPRDKCHAVSMEGSCLLDRMGDGNWDRNAYYVSNGYGAMPTTWSNYGYPELSGRSTPTRFQQYRYEYDNRATMLAPKSVLGGFTQQGTPIWPAAAPGTPPGSTPDRRVLTIAVVNCVAEDIRGKTEDVEVVDWVDVFMVEPSAPRERTEKSDFYIEVIGRTSLGGGASQGQEVRKDVPYLIE